MVGLDRKKAIYFVQRQKTVWRDETFMVFPLKM